MDAVQPQRSPGPDQFVGGVAEDLLHAITDVKELPVCVGRPDDVRDVGDERAVFPLAGAEGLLAPFAMSDVLDDGLELERLAVFAKEAADAVLLPHGQAVEPDDAVVERDDRLLRGQGFEPTQGDGEVFHRQGLQEIGAEQFIFGFAVKAAVGAVDEGEGAVGLEPANQIGLVFHNRAQAFLAFRHSLFGLRGVRRRRPPGACW